MPPAAAATQWYIPETMASSVFLARKVSLGETSTEGRRAVSRSREEAIMERPGQMTPPRKAPSEPTQSKVIAVPKSTTISALP